MRHTANTRRPKRSGASVSHSILGSELSEPSTGTARSRPTEMPAAALPRLITAPGGTCQRVAPDASRAPIAASSGNSRR
jgi:hypothetical protein